MSGNESHRIRRRTVLKSATATTAGLAASTMSAAAENLSGEDREEIIAEARADSQVQKLIQTHEFIGQQKWNDAEVIEVTMDGDRVHFVRVPYAVEGIEYELESAEIVWNDSGETPPTAVHIKEDSSDTLAVAAYFPSKSDDENVLEVEIDRNSDEATDSPISTQQSPPGCCVTGPASMCGFQEVPNLSCAYNWVQENEDVSRSCSMFTASIATEVVPVIIAGGFWCAWDLYQDGTEPTECDLCTDDLDEAASGIPIDSSDIPTDPDDYPDRPSWDDLPFTFMG